MIGAVASHVKVKDPLQKSVPSFTLGCMCACILATYFNACAECGPESHSYPPALFATASGRWTAFLTMSVVFVVLVFQMLTMTNSVKAKKISAGDGSSEPLLGA